ncbi:MAG TPA: LLM class flavin-dependent oxidoreductase, partial [Acidimicrobiia bacterium]|nr:LLM class flavin-dependent oxidoreductase [Acidimicrobiia bacterium]
QLLTDGLEACKVLWRDTPASFESPTLSFRDIYCEPKPAQRDGVPLWISGTLHRRNIERLVRAGDAWIPIMGATLDDIAAGAALIRDEWAVAGRDPDDLQVRAPLPLVPGDVGATMESLPAVVATGATDVHVPLRAFTRDPADAPKVMDELVRRFRDAI